MFDQTRLLQIIAKQDSTVTASAIRAALWCLKPFYRVSVGVRNLFFTLGWFKSKRVSVPVISIGNLTTGGTGKTPIVIWLARALRSRGVQVAILSRGYGALENGENDEARELAIRLPDVPNLIGPDRSRSAEIALEELEMKLLLMDDGFQHRQLARNSDWVLIDATCPFGFGQLLPRGLLREPVSSLCRADVVLITRADCVDSSVLAAIENRVRRANTNLFIAHARFAPQHWLQANGQQSSIDKLFGQRCLVFCGVGNPEGVRVTMRSLPLDVVAERVFPDHHHYSDDDLADIEQQGRTAHAECLICTSKDLVKINRNRLGTIPLYALEIETKIIFGNDVLQTQIDHWANIANGRH